MRGSIFCMTPLVLLEALPLHVIVYLSCICTCTMFYTTRDWLWIFLVCTCTCVHLLVGSPQSIHVTQPCYPYMYTCTSTHIQEGLFLLSVMVYFIHGSLIFSKCLHKMLFLLMCSYSSYGRMYMHECIVDMAVYGNFVMLCLMIFICSSLL